MGLLLLTKTIFVIMIGFFGANIMGLFLVPYLKRKKVKQPISGYVSWHENKSGTPTMGGLIFVIPVLVVTFFLILFNKLSLTSDLLIILVTFLGYSFIGLLDDLIKIKSKHNEGLKVLDKLFLQVLLALFIFYLYLYNGGSTVFQSTTLGYYVDLKWLYGIFILLILVGFSNAVNITDGLDGLASGLSIISFIAYALVAFVSGFYNLGLFIFLLIGAVGGFLLFNTHPARIFMGDVGSLGLGATMGMIAILTHKEITLLVVAFVFVVETLSVILQTLWMFLSHKKLFLMTPLHHHFEKLGYAEQDIVKAYWVLGLFFSFIGIYFAVWL